MTRMTRAEEERIIEAIVNTIVDYDAPNWVRDIVRNELRKQRGLTEKKQAKKKPEQKLMGYSAKFQIIDE